MLHIVSALLQMAITQPKLAFEILTDLEAEAPPFRIQTSEQKDGRAAIVHKDATGTIHQPEQIISYGEDDDEIVIATFADGTIRVRVAGYQPDVIHNPNVLVGQPYYTSDDAIDALRVSGRFEGLAHYDIESLRTQLVKVGLIDAGMTHDAFTQWAASLGA